MAVFSAISAELNKALTGKSEIYARHKSGYIRPHRVAVRAGCNAPNIKRLGPGARSMKIADRKISSPAQPNSPAGPLRRPGAEGSEPAAAKPAVDRVAVMDIPESEFTPKVRAAIMALM